MGMDRTAGPSECPDDDTDDERLCAAQHFLASLLRRLEPESGWERAWEEFYRIGNDLLQGYALRCRVPQQKLDDCLQEAWKDIYQKLIHFRREGRPGSLRHYFFMVLRSKAADIRRYSSRHCTESLGKVLHDKGEPCDPHPGPGEEEDRTWKQELVRLCLAELHKEVSEVNYKIVHLHYMEGLPIRDVATLVSMTEAQVWPRLNRMLKKLRTLINTYSGHAFDRSLDMPDRGK